MPEETDTADVVNDTLERQSPRVGSMFMTGDYEDQPPLPLPPRAPILPPQAAFQAPPPPNPIDQAQQATAAAIKFQGVRGYQNDLQNGVSPAEALTKWAPSMFGSAGTGPLPAVPRDVRGIPLPPPPADFRAVKSAQPQIAPAPIVTPAPAAPSPPVMLSGVAYRWNADRSALQEVPGQRPRKVAVDTQDAKFLADTMKALDKVSSALADDPENPTLKQRQSDLMGVAEAARMRIRQSQSQATVQPPTAPVRQGPGMTFIGPKLGARPPVAAPSANPPKVTTQAQYDALPPGAVYISKNGKPHRKPYADRD